MKDSLKGSMINFQDFHLQGSIQTCPIFTPLTVLFLPQMTICAILKILLTQHIFTKENETNAFIF